MSRALAAGAVEGTVARYRHRGVPMIRTLVSFALLVPTAALACPGKEMAATSDVKPVLASATANLDPTHCAKNAALVGDNCSYSTNLMAQRVHAEGKETTVTAKLEKTDKVLSSQVAAPWAVGDMRVIANEVAESLDAAAMLSMTGKVLEVDGVKYLLVTAATKSNT